MVIELGYVIRSSDIYYKTQIIKGANRGLGWFENSNISLGLDIYLKIKRIRMNGEKSLLQADNYGKSISKIKKIDWFEYKIRYIDEINKNLKYKQLLQTLSFFVNNNNI